MAFVTTASRAVQRALPSVGSLAAYAGTCRTRFRFVAGACGLARASHAVVPSGADARQGAEVGQERVVRFDAPPAVGRVGKLEENPVVDRRDGGVLVRV